MSKTIKELRAEAIELGIDITGIKKLSDYQNAIDEFKKVVEAENQKNSKMNGIKTIKGVDPSHKMRLVTKSGKAVYLTVEEASKPWNKKQLSKKSKDAIEKGVSATELLSSKS